ncbi:uncharacterized protein (UPF0332 family) [Methanococcus voltae]|uniref:DNA-binding protein n=1 Tax=Methanococcus voltae TaxID=2188 RepID=UPI001AE2CED1|nr:DNA-binding protein [Methanococcus voltae]MBP2144083.1 uncharacterized protein (UPF0332 family) [Methanococcus voltae]
MFIITNYFENEKELNYRLRKYKREKVIGKFSNAKMLVNAHVEKTNHNLEFVNHLMEDESSEFNDWKITGLYYAVYHASLALVCLKGYISKNHTATLLFLIKYYSDKLNSDDIHFIDELALNKEDLLFYADLKSERQKASYSTTLNFSNKTVEELRFKSIEYINKVEEIIENSKKSQNKI